MMKNTPSILSRANPSRLFYLFKSILSHLDPLEPVPVLHVRVSSWETMHDTSHADLCKLLTEHLIDKQQ